MEERKFITPVSMKCTQEQYERDLKKPLEELGYEEGSLTFGDKEHLTNCNGLNEFEVWTFFGYEYSYLIDHYNPELFLALAAMTEGDFIKGEYATHKKGRCIFKILFNNTGIVEPYRKATKEELIKHFSKDMKRKSVAERCREIAKTITVKSYHNNVKKENRFPFELDLEGARKIIDVACEGWKDKLYTKFGKGMILSGTIIIRESFYKEMRDACSEEQHKVLDEVFGKDEKSVESSLRYFLYDKTPLSFDRAKTDLLSSKLLETFDIKFKE